MIDTILDIAHAVDGIATCVEKTISGDDDLASFDPEYNDKYREIPAI